MPSSPDDVQVLPVSRSKRHFTRLHSLQTLGSLVHHHAKKGKKRVYINSLRLSRHRSTSWKKTLQQRHVEWALVFELSMNFHPFPLAFEGSRNFVNMQFSTSGSAASARRQSSRLPGAAAAWRSNWAAGPEATWKFFDLSLGWVAGLILKGYPKVESIKLTDSEIEIW